MRRCCCSAARLWGARSSPVPSTTFRRSTTPTSSKTCSTTCCCATSSRGPSARRSAARRRTGSSTSSSARSRTAGCRSRVAPSTTPASPSGCGRRPTRNCSRSAPITSTRRVLSMQSSTAARPRSSRAPPRGRCRRRGSVRSRASRTSPHGSCCCERSSWGRRSSAGTSPPVPRRSWESCRSSRRRWQSWQTRRPPPERVTCRRVPSRISPRLRRRSTASSLEPPSSRTRRWPWSRKPITKAASLALDRRARVARWIGRLGEAEEFEQQAIEQARAAGRKDQEARAALQLAGIYIGRMEEAKAEPLIDRALELAEHSGSIVAQASAASSKAQFLRVRGNYEAAIGWYTKALELYREAGSVADIAWTSRHLGIVAWETGDAEKAEKLLRESIRLLAPMRERGRSARASATSRSSCSNRAASTRPRSTRWPHAKRSAPKTPSHVQRRVSRSPRYARHNIVTRKRKHCSRRRSKSSAGRSTAGSCSTWSRRTQSFSVRSSGRTRQPSSMRGLLSACRPPRRAPRESPRRMRDPATR